MSWRSLLCNFSLNCRTADQAHNNSGTGDRNGAELVADLSQYTDPAKDDLNHYQDIRALGANGIGNAASRGMRTATSTKASIPISSGLSYRAI